MHREVHEAKRSPDTVAQSAQLEWPGVGHLREEQRASVGQQEDRERRAGPQRAEHVGGQRGARRVERAAESAHAAHVFEMRAVNVQLAAREPIEEVQKRRVGIARHDERHELRAVHHLHALPEKAREWPGRPLARSIGDLLVAELSDVQTARVQRGRGPEHRV